MSFKCLLLGSLGLVISFSAYAIDSADDVIRSIECQAVKAKSVKSDDDTRATIVVAGSRRSPVEPLAIDYVEEFWANTANGPQHRTIQYSGLECRTLWYRTGASSLIGRAHYTLNCQGVSDSGDAVVVLDLDSRANRNTKLFVGYTGQTGQYPLECSYKEF